MDSPGYLGGVNMMMVFFIIMCILVGFIGTWQFFKNGQPIAGFLFLIGALTIFIIYGKRWFDPNGIYTSSNTTWPPVINTCPDFLTAYTATIGNASVRGCVDTVGVSRNGNFHILPPSGNPVGLPNAPYAVNNGVVNATLTDFFPINVPGETPQALCDRLANYGLTWDGIFDGDNCMATSGS
jgi:hypothetical protein